MVVRYVRVKGGEKTVDRGQPNSKHAKNAVSDTASEIEIHRFI